MSTTTAGQTGSAKKQSSSSLSAMISTLVPTVLLAAAFVTAFLIARKYFRRVYAPRTYLNHLGQQRQTPAQGGGFLGWIKGFAKIKDAYILDHQSIDGYLFVRFFKVLIVTSFLGCLITWPVLFPVNATGGAGQTQLDLLSMSNISTDGKNINRYYAHALISVVFLMLVLVIIARESFYTVNLRQAYRRSPWGASRLSSRTILFTNVPKTLSQTALFEMFPGVKHAWVASNTKDLDELVEDRDKTAMKLEAGEVQLSRDANMNRIKADKGKKHFVASDVSDGTKWIDPKKRPTHKLKFLIGKKVDTIEYGRSHLAELLPKITQEQDKHWNGQGDLVGAVFLEFDTQRHAQDAWQVMQKRKTKPNKKLQARQLGVMPQEVVWGNLRIKPAEHLVRWAIATAFITVMIIFFAIPVSFVGLISNINYLASRFSWLSWILKIPKVILGVITGLLPSVLLAVLMALVPIVCRLMAKLAGYVTYSQIELKTQSWYFAFQVVQVFLVATLSSAITSVINDVLNNPGIVLKLLAQNLPKASNFYTSYFLLLGFSFAASTLLNIGGFVVVVLLGRILPGKTPRKIFDKLTKLSSPSWGSEFPKWTNLAVIAITYSGIAPLILGFAVLCFSLIYIAFKYNFLYVYETNIDTKGEAYQKALGQLLTGVYLSEICLLGLFAIATADNIYAVGPLAIMAVLLALTILFHITLGAALRHEEARLAYTDPAGFNGHHTATNGHHEDGLHGEKAATQDSTASNMAPKASRMPLFLRKIFNPERHSIHTLSSQLDQFYHTPQEPLPIEIQKRAFFNPSVTSPAPVLWIVKDDMGISAREIRDTQKAVPGLHVTDEQATFNEKGKVYWQGAEDGMSREAPVFDERIVY
ncbi:phosphate metabolism protein 7 [Neocucurbitaria cava]|uniref:Phosphate metabolism protein 7 n=1 Tax=Neocucurbitaria cava TaxID=798079 RepID=A0A9W8YBG2_9PLEO|nr:phosphate metabolism protein 7 [Neocucurbitaria cava]